MNKSKLEVRLGNSSDIPSVMEFIKKYWKVGHILSTDRQLFEYLYLEKDGGLNFVLAFEPEANELIAILGFSSSNLKLSRVSTSMWRSRDDFKFRKYRAGAAVYNFLFKKINADIFFSNTINPDTIKFYEFLKFSCYLMDHFIYVNNNIEKFTIVANPPQQLTSSPLSETPITVLSSIIHSSDLRRALKETQFLDNRKDFWYLEKRYLMNPRFAYNVREVLVENESIGLIVYRRQFVNSSSCIRIIDVIGDGPCLLAAFPTLIKEMYEQGDEYIDLVCWGLDTDAIKKTGLVDRRKYPECVVPELFSPFIRENLDRWLFTNNPDIGEIYKGDGDQDRPN